MDSLKLLKVLIQKLEEYEREEQDKSSLSLEGFCNSVRTELDLESVKNNYIEPQDPNGLKYKNTPFIENNIERVIAQHLLFLYRYIKFYSKLVFEESKIKSIEEFGFLITVMQYDTISKSELIKKNILEKSSGIEMINRLIKSGLLIQKDNPDDQRSHLVLLTDSGKMELYQIFEKMNTLGVIATGELNRSEKAQLALILKKLDNFHFGNYNNKQLKNLNDYRPFQNKP